MIFKKRLNQMCQTMCLTDNASVKLGCSLIPKDVCQSLTNSSQKVTSDDIVLPIMQHSDCDSLLADMQCPFNNTSMVFMRELHCDRERAKEKEIFL